MSVRAAVVGASGYTGGELLRLLLGHPRVQVVQATSRSLAGRPVHHAHPNLRGHTDLIFTDPNGVVGESGQAEACDVLFLCLPHGQAAGRIQADLERCRLVVDLSADVRLRDPVLHQQTYGEPHPDPDLLSRAVYGLPELTRAGLPGASLISGVGCNATAMILALLPLARAGLIERAIADLKVGSSEAGAEPGESSHHPVRSGAVRTYSPWGHRHLAEVRQALGPIPVDATVTAVERIRGVLCTAHVITTRRLQTRDLFGLYRETYAGEPFVRVVADRSGLHRLPDPKVLAGSNHADVGFALDEASGRVVCLSALDNLVKGAAGSAVQSMNIALGFGEAEGLGFVGLHPA